LEIWALEGHEGESAPPEDLERVTTSRSSTRSRDKGKGKASRRRGMTEEEWTDEVPQASVPPTGTATETLEQKVEMELDDEADGLLRHAMSRVRGGRGRRRLDFSPDTEATETPGPAGARSRGSRARS
jgi:anaphase-promoting complex subunit 6